MIIAGVNQIVNPFLEQEFSISLTQAGFITTLWGVGVVLGGVTGGSLIQVVGRKQGTRISIAISLLAVLALSATNSLALAWPTVAIFGLAYGTYQTVYFTLSMNFTDSRIAASMFSIMMAISNIAQGVGMALSGVLVDTIDYRVTFIIFGLLNFVALPLIPIVFRKSYQHEKIAV